MAKIQTSCPQCKQPLVAEINQVVDINRTPQLKDILLSGGLNLAQCQLCGFQGQLPVPLVYHDSKKELLLTFSPPDLNRTMQEKEAALAPLLQDIITNLKPEERKGYLFQPQTMLTMNNLVKNVLLGDGITEEMIQDQQDKMQLLDQLFSKSGDQLVKTVQENSQKIDREFFALFAEIAQRILTSQDEKTIMKIQEIQDVLMAETEIGKEILKESQEIQAARQSLEALGQNLTRQSLLELVVAAPTMERVKAMAALVRPAMDYEFFQIFTERIEKTEDKLRNGLVERRNLLLKITQEIDSQVAENLNSARSVLNRIVEAENPEEELLVNLANVDQYFIQALSGELELAEKNQQTERKSKLEIVLSRIQELSTPTELKIMDQLMSTADDDQQLAEAVKLIDENALNQLLEYMTGVIGQYQERLSGNNQKDRKELEDSLALINKVYSAVLKRSMRAKLKNA